MLNEIQELRAIADAWKFIASIAKAKAARTEATLADVILEKAIVSKTLENVLAGDTIEVAKNKAIWSFANSNLERESEKAWEEYFRVLNL